MTHTAVASDGDDSIPKKGEANSAVSATASLRNKGATAGKPAEMTARPAVYSIRGFGRFVRSMPSVDTVLIVLFTLLSWGQKMFDNAYSIDTEAIMAVQQALYSSWIRLERFGLVWIKKILGLGWYNNSLASFLGPVVLAFAGLLWVYLINNVTAGADTRHPAFFVIPFVSAPIFAAMIGFTMMAPEVALAVGLVAVSLMALINGFETHRLRSYVWAILIASVSFSIYLVMVTLFIAGFAMCFVAFVWGRPELSKQRQGQLIGIAALTFVLSYGVYWCSNKAVLAIYHTYEDPYITNQSHWGHDPLNSIMAAIGNHAVDLYRGRGIFYSGFATLVLFGLWVMALVVMIRDHRQWLLFIVTTALFIAPLLMTVITGGAPSVRTEMVYPLVTSFALFWMADRMMRLDISNIKWRGVTTAIVWVLVIALSWSQALITSRIFYTEDVNHRQDVALFEQINARIVDLGKSDPAQPVVYVGSAQTKCDPDCFTNNQLELVGRSIPGTTVSMEQGNFVKQHFMQLQGHEYATPSLKQQLEGERAAKHMPTWPAKGSVAVKNGLVIVRLS